MSIIFFAALALTLGWAAWHLLRRGGDLGRVDDDWGVKWRGR